MPDHVRPTAGIELHGVSKSYGLGKDQQVRAADNVTITIAAGGSTALTGASGSGKSTLLHLIGAIDRPDSGTIISNGTEVTALRGGQLAEYRRTVGFVFRSDQASQRCCTSSARLTARTLAPSSAMAPR